MNWLRQLQKVGLCSPRAQVCEEFRHEGNDGEIMSDGEIKRERDY